MNTRKIAITIPKELISTIDKFSRQKGISRSKYISSILAEKIDEEQKKRIKTAYDAVFSDEAVCKEQLETTAWFENAGNKAGQEW